MTTATEPLKQRERSGFDQILKEPGFEKVISQTVEDFEMVRNSLPPNAQDAIKTCEQLMARHVNLLTSAYNSAVSVSRIAESSGSWR